MKQKTLHLIKCVFLFTTLLLAFNANAKTWVGAGSAGGNTTTDINAASGWSPAVAPTAGDDLTMTLVSAASLTSSIATTVNSFAITFTPASVVTPSFTMGANLTIANNFNITSNPYGTSPVPTFVFTVGTGTTLTCGSFTGINNHTSEISRTMVNVNGSMVCNNDLLLNMVTLGGTVSNIPYAGVTISVAGSLTVNGATTINNASTIGTASISAITNGVVTFNGNVTLSQVNTTYGAAIIGSTNGIVNFNGQTFTAGDYSTIDFENASKLVFDGSGANSAQTFSIGTSFYMISPNLIIGNINTPTVTFAGSGNFTMEEFPSYPSTNSPVSLTIKAGATLDINTHTINYSLFGTITGTLNLNGKLKLAGANNFPASYTTYNVGANSTVEYNGAIQQTIKTGITYGNIIFNNTSGGLIYTSGIPKVATSATFSNGVLNNRNAGSTNALAFLATSAIAGTPSTTNYVDGYVSDTGHNAFVFPIGNSITDMLSSTNYHPISVTAPSANTNIIAAYVIGTTPNATNLNNITAVDPTAYWPVSSSLSATSQVSIVTHNEQNVFAAGSKVFIAGYNIGTAKWEAVSTPILPTGDGQTLITTNAIDMSLYSAYTLGAGLIVLPVTLTYFKGDVKNCMVNLNWQTAQEINNGYFAIEKSTDGLNFNIITNVLRKNSATGATYNYLSSLEDGTTYFRLKMVDVDADYAYSSIIAVNGTGGCNASLMVKMLPNPVTDVLNIQGVTSGNHISLVNEKGQILTKIIATGTNENINFKPFAKGVYMVKVQTSNGVGTTIKVVKQ